MSSDWTTQVPHGADWLGASVGVLPTAAQTQTRRSSLERPPRPPEGLNTGEVLGQGERGVRGWGLAKGGETIVALMGFLGEWYCLEDYQPGFLKQADSHSRILMQSRWSALNWVNCWIRLFVFWASKHMKFHAPKWRLCIHKSDVTLFQNSRNDQKASMINATKQPIYSLIHSGWGQDGVHWYRPVQVIWWN